MTAKIFRHGINWRIEFYNSDGSHMDYCGEWISGFCDNPLQTAIDRANWLGCKEINILD